MTALPATPDTQAAAPRARTSELVTNIRPSRGLFDLQLEQVWTYRDLLMTLVKRDVQILYKQAALGAAWAVIQPVFAVFIFTVVFGTLAKMPTPNGIPYPVFSFAAVLPWNYFAEGVRRGGTGLVTEAELVRKVYFPRILILLSGVIAPLLDLAIGFGVLLVVMLAYGVMPTLQILAVIPLTLVAGLLALSISMWLGPINVKYRDVKHTLTFLLQIWMYASPVVYSFSMVPDAWKWFYSLNPMVGVIEGFRWAITGVGHPDLIASSVGGGLMLLLLLGGLVFFKKTERHFADLI